VIAIADQVDPGWAGQSVVAHTGQLGGSGGYAEQAVADLIPVPPRNKSVRGRRAAARRRHRDPPAHRGRDQARGVGHGHRGGMLGRAAFEAAAVGGRFFAHGISDGGFAALDPEQVSRRGVTVHALGEYHPEMFRQEAASALTQAADGRLRPVIGQSFPLARAADAHAALEVRTAIAKTLLVP
jgi:NADPH:quinone reductase-like Zn-dependent oxidoreductase